MSERGVNWHERALQAEQGMRLLFEAIDREMEKAKGQMARCDSENAAHLWPYWMGRLDGLIALGDADATD